MGRHYLINGVKVPFTAEQETARNASEVAAAERDVTKSKSVIDKRRVMIMKLKIKIKKKLITEDVTSS